MKHQLWPLALLCFFINTLSAPLAAQEKESAGEILLYAQLRMIEPPEEVKVSFWENPLDLSVDAPEVKISWLTPAQGTMYQGAYGEWWLRYRLPVNAGGYLSMSMGRRRLLEGYRISPGDSIQMFFNEATQQTWFTGPAAPQFRLQQSLRHLKMQELLEEPVGIHVRDKTAAFSTEAKRESFEAGQASFGREVELIAIDPPAMLRELAANLKARQAMQGPGKASREAILAPYRSQMPKPVWTGIAADAFGHWWLIYLGRLQTLLRYTQQLGDEDMLSALRAFYDRELRDWEPYHDFSEYEAAAASALAAPEGYYNSLYEKAKLQAALFEQSLPEAIASQHSGIARDRLYAQYIIRNYRDAQAPVSQFEDLAGQIATEDIAKSVGTFMEKFTPGAPIRYFAFADSQGDTVTMNDLAGKVVFLNSWFTGCGASSAYYKRTIRKVAAHFRGNAQVAFVSLSIDTNQEIWQSGLATKEYALPEGINLFAGEKGGSHPFFKHYHIQGYPSPMLIDGEGKLLTVRDMYEVEAIINNIEKALKEGVGHRR